MHKEISVKLCEKLCEIGFVEGEIDVTNWSTPRPEVLQLILKKRGDLGLIEVSEREL